MTADGSLEHDEGHLLDAARHGDELAYRELVEVHRDELHAHCYRLLASVHDADDAVQDALVRAWSGLSRFEGRSSVRTWLFKIATNAALDTARRRAGREAALEQGPPAAPGESPGDPQLDRLWIEPYPDLHYGARGGLASPEARYELRESLELAFVAALQHLPARQRAVLVLREVLGFSASEVAGILDTSVTAVNSALQRARAAARARIPTRSQQAELASLGERGVRELAAAYSSAIERGDVDRLVSMLAEGATWAMPPLPTWYLGREAIAEFHRVHVCSQRWRHRTTTANGQLAVGCYIFDDRLDAYVASVLDVLSLDGGRIRAVTGFLTAELLECPAGDYPSFEAHEAFPRFALPLEVAC
jgi:RNA polymerase sigma-70 factor (ECF subfamily)